ncbi:MAG: dihydropteroate synthase [Granulosicoccaceae bacterium]
MKSSLRCGSRSLDLSRPQVMGILNVTPDSFSDGGVHSGSDAVLDHAVAMVEAGASIIDVGGESTRPGAAEVSEAQELERVIPAIEQIANTLDVVISVDTSKAEVIRQACAAGATFINDVRALRLPGALEAAAETDAAVCLMHMQGDPQTMQASPVYTDIIQEIAHFLSQRCDVCCEAGIARERLLIDPGFGFGKTLEHNLQLVAKLKELSELQLPLLFGASRKGTIGTLLDATVDKRMVGSVAMALMAVERGANIVRVHDVQETVEALMIFNAVNEMAQSAID